MKYRRYGKFRFKNYAGNLIVLTCGFLLAVACSFIDADVLPCCFIFGAILVFSPLLILRPYSEWFSIQEHSIYTYQRGSISEIELPENCTLILSNASLGFQVSRLYRLRDRYAVSILRDISPERVLGTLHTYYAQNYTNTTIERDFPAYFVYSCVYDREILAQLLEQGAARIIVPAKLADRFDLSMAKCEILADQGLDQERPNIQP